MSSYLINKATLINEGKTYTANLLIEDAYISKISAKNIHPPGGTTIIEAEGKLLIPGVIDDQVHFREPGLTHKGDIYTESRAAAAGGVTSFMEMPNTMPQATTIKELDKKFEIASEKSLVNFSFYLGATNDNIDEIKKIDPESVCGLKVFMGSSTGNMLVDNIESLDKIFAVSPVLIATHCEDENTIRKNTSEYFQKYGENIPFRYHAEIRSAEACYLSSSLAVSLAKKHGSRLHVLHISTEKELDLFRNDIPSTAKMITSEVCIHHLWFNDKFYDTKGSLIKWNPAVKKESDQKALLEAVLNNKLDVIATDHAPHTLEEKNNPYFKSPSGGPMVQHSLVTMLEFATKGYISREKVIEKMCHTPADIFQVEKRGYLKEGYFADIVLVDPRSEWTVSKNNLHYKCGWSPLEGTLFSSSVKKTFVNGKLVFDEGELLNPRAAMPLKFNR